MKNWKLVSLLALFLLLCHVGSSYAQELEVKSFERLDRDLMARTQERLDLNDTPCAVVRVSVPNANTFVFEGNVVGDVAYKTGEAIVYMAARSREITIKNDQYGTLTYKFPERLAKRTVYRIDLRIVVGNAGNVYQQVENVYLKNGSMIRGVLIEQIPGESVKVQTSDGSIYVYKMTEIDKIVRGEDVPVNYIQNYSYKLNRRGARKGYGGFIEGGYTFRSLESGMNFSTSHGYQFNPYFYTGVGVGVSLLASDTKTYYAIPVFADFRFNFLNNSITPFIGVKVGYSFNDSELEGWYIAPAVGCRFSINRNLAVNLNIGYTRQKYIEKYAIVDDRDYCDGCTIRFGLEF